MVLKAPETLPSMLEVMKPLRLRKLAKVRIETSIPFLFLLVKVCIHAKKGIEGQLWRLRKSKR